MPGVLFGAGEVAVVPNLKDFVAPLLRDVKKAMTTASDQAGKTFTGGLQTRLQGLKSSLTPTNLGFAAVGAAAVIGLDAAFTATEHLGEEVHQLSLQLGLTAEEASKLRFAGSELGLSTDQLAAGFGIFEKHLVDGGKAFEKYGITIQDAQGHQKSFEGLLGEVADKYVALGGGIKGAAFALDVFGRGGKQLIPLLAQGSAGLEKYAQRAEELGLVMSGEDVKSAHDLAIAHRDLSAAVLGLEVQVGTALLPTLKTLSDEAMQLSPILGDLGKAFAFLTSGVSGRVLRDIATMGFAELLTHAPQASHAVSAGFHSIQSSAVDVVGHGLLPLGSALDDLSGPTDRAAVDTKKLAAEQQRAADAARAEKQANQALLPGLLGIDSQILQLGRDHATLVGLQHKGKQGTLDYRAAVVQALQDQEGLNQSLQQYAANLVKSGHSEGDVEGRIRSLGQQFGLQKGPLNELIRSVDAYIRKLHGIPPNVDTTITTWLVTKGSGLGIKQAQHGFHGDVVGPQLFMVEPGMHERVDITPRGEAASIAARLGAGPASPPGHGGGMSGGPGRLGGGRQQVDGRLSIDFLHGTAALELQMEREYVESGV